MAQVLLHLFLLITLQFLSPYFGKHFGIHLYKQYAIFLVVGSSLECNCDKASTSIHLHTHSCLLKSYYLKAALFHIVHEGT